MQMYKIKSNSQQQRIKKLTSYLVMTVIGIVLIIPLLWMVFTSLKPMEEIVRYPPTFFQKKSISQIILIRSMRFLFGNMQRTPCLSRC